MNQELYRNLLFKLRGAVNPVLLRLHMEEKYSIEKSVLLFGNYRGGTTWISGLLSSATEAAVLFEPTHKKNGPTICHIDIKGRYHMDSRKNWPEGVIFFENILSSDGFNSWTTGDIPISSVLRIRSWIIKLIGCSTLAPWIVENIATKKPVMIMRHPAAIYASRVKRGWAHTGKNKLLDKPFFEANPQYQAVYERVSTPVDVFAMRWCIDQIVLLSLGDRIHRICYEELRQKGVAMLEPVFRSWGKPVPNNLEERFYKPSSKVSSGFDPSGFSPTSSWRNDLDKTDVDRIMSIVKDFGIEFYTKDDEPDFKLIKGYTPEIERIGFE